MLTMTAEHAHGLTCKHKAGGEHHHAREGPQSWCTAASICTWSARCVLLESGSERQELLRRWCAGRMQRQ